MIGQYDELILASCDRFLGYGSPTAPVWFVGKQQGGGVTWEECRQRLDAWHARGRQPLEDIVAYHRAIGVDLWFADPPKVQPTWRELIRIRLAMAGEAISEAAIARYQVDRMAGSNGENCLLELLPLSSRKPNDTAIYAANSKLDWLRNGKALMAQYGGKRAQRLKLMINEHRPKAVVFYSYSKTVDEFQRFWRFIAGIDLKRTTLPFTAGASRDGTLYLIIPHPIRAPYLGLSNPMFFRDVGRFIASQL